MRLNFSTRNEISIDTDYDWGEPTVGHNDTWDNTMGDYGGLAAAGPNDISAAPMFINPVGADYHLQAGSPCIDAGTNTGAPTQDIEGNPRPVDGDGDGTATTDMGAYEYVYVPPPPPPPPAVGGEAYPVSKLGILAPWIGLAMLLIGSITWFTLGRRRAQG